MPASERRGTAPALWRLLQTHQEAAARDLVLAAEDPPINLLQAAGRGTDERLYCSLLAWLLNPRGSHCKGTAFLRAITDSLSLPVDRLEAAQVTTEVAQEESRVDVEVALPGALLLHIEAKVDSAEGEDQSPREARDLLVRARRFGVADSQVRSLYLTRRGESAKAPSFVPRSWKDLAQVLRPVASGGAEHPKVKALVGHVLECFEALSSGDHMGSHELGEVDRFLLDQHAEVLALQRSWEDLQGRVLSGLTERAWTDAVREVGVAGEWEVYLSKKSGWPLFRRSDWLVGGKDEWTCIDTGNITLRGLLSTEPREQAWVGVWWGKLRDTLDDELPTLAKKWAAKLPGGSKGVRFETNYGLWWSFRVDLSTGKERFEDLPKIVVREWAKLEFAFDEIAELSRRARKR